MESPAAGAGMAPMFPRSASVNLCAAEGASGSLVRTFTFTVKDEAVSYTHLTLPTIRSV